MLFISKDLHVRFHGFQLFLVVLFHVCHNWLGVVKKLPSRRHVVVLDIDYGNFHEQTWDILMSILSAICNIIGPWNKYKVIDLRKVTEHIRDSEHEDITVRIGLLENWPNSNDVVFEKGKLIENANPQICSSWATPIFEINGEMIAAWRYSSRPLFWRDYFNVKNRKRT